MKFQRKFKVGDLVKVNKRAPREYAVECPEPSVVLYVYRSTVRTHLMYSLPGITGPRIGFYSDELDLVKPKVQWVMKYVSRDKLGRFCKIVNPAQMVLPLKDA